MTPEEQKIIDEARAIANARPGTLYGVARPAPHLRAALRLMNSVNEGEKSEIPLSKAMDQAEAISQLADKLKSMLAKCVSASGPSSEAVLENIDVHLLAAMLIKDAEN